MRTIGVIGAGVMGEALISALIKSGVDGSAIAIYEKRAERTQELIDKYGVISSDVKDVAARDVVLLVVKPQDMAALLEGTEFGQNTLLVSFAAGKTTDFIQSLSKRSRVIRVMPNTPTLVGEGMSAISATQAVQDGDKKFVREFLETAGKVIEVPEHLQDAVTATSGSGPAYFFAFVEAMIAAATSLGLSTQDASTLAIQTMIGSAKLLAESGETPQLLREKVTSPNGTTAAALASFNQSNLAGIVKKAMEAAQQRSQELA